MEHYTLSQLSARIGQALEIEMDDAYWVSAEIASLSQKGGHMYLDLVEKGERGLFVARGRATCWNGRQQILCAYFEQETGARLQVGMQVLLKVSVRFHAVYGLSLDIIDIDPRFTLGDLAKQKEQTIQRLKKEGIYDMQRCLRLPTLVRRIAVVSADEAAGYGDFVHQLAQSGYRFECTLFAAIMQGDRAAKSIIAALDSIAEIEEEFDAVVIIRGGGASSDMTCFDDYNLSAHCAQFPLPILSGIGHTRDVSVVDQVAHRSIKTPTAVAAYLVERMEEERNKIAMLRQRLTQTKTRQILIRQHSVERLSERLQHATARYILQAQNKIALYGQKIDLLNPERIYKLGYSLLKKDGKIIQSVEQIAKGDSLIAEMSDGKIRVEVIEK